MSETRYNGGLNCLTFSIPPGVTNAVLLFPIAGQIATSFKNLSGTTLLIMSNVNLPTGVSMTGATLSSLLSNGGFYPLAPSESVAIEGAVANYVAALGSTGTISLIRGIRAGA